MKNSPVGKLNEMEFNNSDEAVAVIVPKLLYFINITSVQDEWITHVVILFSVVRLLNFEWT